MLGKVNPRSRSGEWQSWGWKRLPDARLPHPAAPELGGRLRLTDEEAGLGRSSPRSPTDRAEQALCPWPPRPTPRGEFAFLA